MHFNMSVAMDENRQINILVNILVYIILHSSYFPQYQNMIVLIEVRRRKTRSTHRAAIPDKQAIMNTGHVTWFRKHRKDQAIPFLSSL